MNKLKKELVAICRRLYDKGFIVALDGNVSVRTPDGRISITPGGMNKGSLRRRDLLVLDAAGRTLRKSTHQPSSETSMHLAIYQARSDVNAIVHAHPPISTAFAVTGTALPIHVLPEVVLLIGEIALVPYSTPGSADLAKSTADHLRRCDAALLQNHGVVTLGRDLQEAYHRLETVEHLADVCHLARQIGDIRMLPADSIAELEKARQRKME